LNVVEHAVLVGPGPIELRSKCTEPKVMKSVTGKVAVAAFRSRMVPVTPVPTVPEEVVRFVFCPVTTHPVPPPTGCVQSMVVPVTTTPPPEQFVTVKWPNTAADALGAIAMSASPTASEYAVAKIFLRIYFPPKLLCQRARRAR
jgi:hypothetical protein